MPDQQLLLWQLVDSALPTGAFAHSGGLEAWIAQRPLAGADDLRQRLRQLLEQTAQQQLPFCLQAWTLGQAVARSEGEQWLSLDHSCHALLSNHVARRASLVQGQALLRVIAETWSLPAVDALQVLLARDRQRGHLAPMTGVLGHMLGLDQQVTARWFMFSQLRDQVSAAIRLGCTGPMHAQSLQAALLSDIDALISEAKADDPVSINPLLELMHANHDRLYSRLFAS